MYKQLIVLVSLVALSSAQALSGWTHCGTTMADVHQITITNCTQTPCSFVRGHTYRLSIRATSRVHSNSLRYELVADFLGLNLPLANGEGCLTLVEGTCPAVPGGFFAYYLDLTVPPGLPDLPTHARLMVFDHNDVQGICIRVDVVPHPNA